MLLIPGETTRSWFPQDCDQGVEAGTGLAHSRPSPQETHQGANLSSKKGSRRYRFISFLVKHRKVLIAERWEIEWTSWQDVGLRRRFSSDAWPRYKAL